MRRDMLLAFRLKSLNNQLRRQFERTAIAHNTANLTGMQYAVLGFVNEQSEDKDVFQRDIEAEFNIRRSTASSMVTQLEREGFVRRESVEGDARLKKITLTEKANELHKIANANMEQLQTRLTRGISKEEMEQFYQTLDKIQRNIED